MVFTGAGQGDIAHGNHFIDLHFVFNKGDFREIGVIKTGENFIDIHFGNAMWCFHQTVISQVEIQQLHDFRHMTGDKAFARFVIHFMHGRAQRCFQSSRNQRFMNQGRFFTE